MKIWEKLERLAEWGGVKRDGIFLGISALALALSLAGWPMPVDPAWIAIVLCGAPILLEAAIGLITRLDIKADLLVSIALVASVVIGEVFAAGEVAFIMQLGGLLEELTVRRARAGIEKLVRLTPRTARVVDREGERMVPAEQVQVGDLLRVLPGETIPVDGVIVAGQTCVDQSVMTGESMPVDKGVGETVCSGAVNQFGAFDMEAVKVGEDSSIQRMIRLVQSADAGKAKIVGIADRWATWVVVAALSAALLTWLFTHEIIRAVTILVVFCPCALVLATPTAIMAAIGNAAKHGFLVREGDALERLAGVSLIAFDKTGTLTYGTPQVEAVRPLEEGMDPEELYAWAASGESRSEHPLGKAVVQGYRQHSGRVEEAPQEFAMVPGRGIEAKVGGKALLAGNLEMLKERGIEAEAFEALAQPYLSRGCTVIYLAVENRPAGIVALTDMLRPQSAQIASRVRLAGAQPVLLTGDHLAAAQTIAQGAGIDQVKAQCLPEDKLDYIAAAQERGQLVCMIGDGVNDAPALKKADIGVAMGITGTEVSKDAASMILADDNFATIVKAVVNGRSVYANIKNAIQFLLSGNTAGIFCVLYASLLALPVPFQPVHLLFINLLTDSLPAIAIGMEPARRGLLDQKPRDPKEPILSRDLLTRIGGQGLLIAIVTMIAFYLGYQGGDAVLASTMAFATLTLARLFHGFNCRGDASIFRLKFSTNKYSVMAFFAGVVLLLAVLFIPGLKGLFMVAPAFGVANLGEIVLLAFLPTLVIQIIKVIGDVRRGKEN